MAQVNVATEASARSGWEAAPEGLRWRMLVSVLGPIAWVCLTLIYVGFWASGFSLFQSIVVVLVSILVMAGVLSAAWITWGPRFRHAWD
jgi:hypothetical protein